MLNSRLFLALAFLSGAVAQTGFAQTSTTVTRNFSFPPVTLASGETMQVNLVNLAVNPTAASGGSTPAAASCTGNVSFLNAAGTPIGTAAPFTVASGVTQSINLAFANAGIATLRGVVRAVIQTATTLGRNAPACSLTASLEVFDSSNITHVYLSSTVNPQNGGPIISSILGGLQ